MVGKRKTFAGTDGIRDGRRCGKKRGRASSFATSYQQQMRQYLLSPAVYRGGVMSLVLAPYPIASITTTCDITSTGPRSASCERSTRARMPRYGELVPGAIQAWSCRERPLAGKAGAISQPRTPAACRDAAQPGQERRARPPDATWIVPSTFLGHSISQKA